LSALGSASTALGQTANVALDIHCPALGAAASQELEARARAELASTPSPPSPPGRLSLDCRGRSAAVVWRRDGLVFERDVSLGSGGASVELLLDALHSVVREDLAARAAEPDLASPASPAAPSPSPEPQLEPSPEPEPDDTGSLAAATEDSNVVATRLQSPPTTQDHGGTTDAEHHGVKVAIELGGDSVLWQGAPGAALGAHAGGRVSLHRAWSLVLLGGAVWGVGATDGPQASALHGVLQIDNLSLAHVALGLGVTVTDLHAVEGSVAQDGATVGLLLSARYVLALGGRFAVHVGPTLEAVAQPLVVQIDGREAFRIPRFIAGMSIDAAADLAP